MSTDWRFLDRMFETELPRRGDGPDGLRWLAQGLAAQDMPELDVLYPHFIAWFATQGEKRYQYRGEAASWLDDLFDGCRELSINPVERSRSVTLSLAPVAARCVRLTYTGFSRGFEVSVGAQTGNPDQTDHIHLGLDGQLRWGSVAQGSGDGGGGEAFPALLEDYGKVWKILPADTADGEPLELIFSNVAPVAGDTEPLEVTITAAAEDWRSKSLEQAAADTAPEPADSSPGDGADADKTDKGQFTGSGRIETKLKADTSNCGGTGVVNDTLCRMPFRIVLKKSAYTRHMTGTYENVMEQGYAGTLNAIAEMQRLQQQPTADLRVDIRMPPIDHGAQGTYDAVIAVKHPDHPEYDSVKSRMATLHAEKGATGRVTINEYTPHVLRGSFEGELYGSTHQDGRLRTISKPVSGRFTIGAPILDDERVLSTATPDEERRQGYHVLGFPHRAYGLRSRIHAMLDETPTGEGGGTPGSSGFGQAGGGGSGAASGSSGAVMQTPSVGATEDDKEHENAENHASSEKPDSEASRAMEDFEDAMTENLKQALDQLPEEARQAVERMLNSK